MRGHRLKGGYPGTDQVASPPCTRPTVGVCCPCQIGCKLSYWWYRCNLPTPSRLLRCCETDRRSCLRSRFGIGPCGCSSKLGLDFWERWFNRFQDRTARWRKDQFHADSRGDFTYGGDLVRRQVVATDNFALVQFLDVLPLDPDRKYVAVHWSVREQWSENPLQTQRGHRRRRNTGSEGEESASSCVAQAPTARESHLRMNATFIRDGDAERARCALRPSKL